MTETRIQKPESLLPSNMRMPVLPENLHPLYQGHHLATHPSS
jgi:hypothetical protein